MILNIYSRVIYTNKLRRPLRFRGKDNSFFLYTVALTEHMYKSLNNLTKRIYYCALEIKFIYATNLRQKNQVFS